MLKLLYIPTGNIFIMPDEQALDYYRGDIHNYKILDAGFQEEKEPEKIDEKDISELVLKSDERAKEIEEEDKAEEEVKEEKYETELDFSKLNKADLVGALKRVGIKCNMDRYTKQKLIEMAIKAGIKP